MTTFGSYQDALLQHQSNVANPAVLHSHLAARTTITDSTTEKPLLADTDGHLKVQLHDQHSGHINNTGGIGDGTTCLRTIDLGYDRTNGQGRSKLVDSAGRQVVNLTGNTSTDGTGTNYHIKADSGGHALVDLKDIYSGAGNNNIGEGTTKLQIFNYGRDVSAGNYKPMVVNSSAEQIVALSATDNSVLDTIATNTANIKVSTDSVNLNVDGLETLVGTTNTNLTTIDAVLDTIKTDTAAIKTAVELLDNCVSGNELQVDIVADGSGGGDASSANQATMITALGTLETTLTAIETDAAALEVLQTTTNTKLGTLETDVEATNTALATIDGVLDNILVDTSAIKVDAAALEVLQTTTNSKLDTLETTLTAIETDAAAIETLITSTNSKIDTLDAVQDNALTKLGEIDTAIDTIDAVLDNILVDTSAIKVDAAALETLQTSTNTKLDTLETTLTAIETDAAALEVLQTSTNSKLDHLSDNLDTLETTLTAIETDAAALEVLQTTTNSKLDTLETTLTAIETDAAAIETLITSTNSKIDTLDAVQDNALTKLGEIDTAIDTLDSVVDGIKTKTDLLGSLTTTRTQNGATIAGSGTNTSSAVEITHNPHSITIFCRSSSGSIGGTNIQISPLVSYDDSNYFDLLEVVDGSGNEIFMTKGAFYNEAMVVIKDARFKYLKVKITNASGTSADFTAHVSF